MKPLEKYKVKKVNVDLMKGYAGMNDEAAGAFGFPLHAMHTVLVSKGMSPSLTEATAKHEMVEEHLMRWKKEKYWKAHKEAIKAERLTWDQIKQKYGVMRVR